MPMIDCGRPWYHGSPKVLSVLRTGSTVTQRLEVARIFSHKPAVVVGDGSDTGWRHSGPFEKGYIYRVVGPVGESDIEPVPNSSMLPGYEWNTKREFDLELVKETKINRAELLSKRELLEMVETGKVPRDIAETIIAKQNLPE